MFGGEGGMVAWMRRGVHFASLDRGSQINFRRPAKSNVVMGHFFLTHLIRADYLFFWWGVGNFFSACHDVNLFFSV